MKVIKFSDYKEDILKVLNEITPPIRCSVCDHPDLSVVDSFVNQMLQDELTGGITLGGRTLPMVATVCNRCFHIDYYSLISLMKKIGKDLEL